MYGGQRPAKQTLILMNRKGEYSTPRFVFKRKLNDIKIIVMIYGMHSIIEFQIE